MFKSRHNELECYLEWRRQTRFLRRHGGPILAFSLFISCFWFVWRACESRRPAPSSSSLIEDSRSHDIDHFMQASKMPKW